MYNIENDDVFLRNPTELSEKIFIYVNILTKRYSIYFLFSSDQKITKGSVALISA